jgi:hypothetical protein
VIYVCVVAHNDAPTVGLLLWKVRQVMAEHAWEYHLLVADDGSVDGTGETLDLYQRALPLTVQRNDAPRGYAASIEALLRDAVERSDRPKRDAAVTLPADFGVSPAALPDLLRRFASGADVVVGEALNGRLALGDRLVRRWAGWLLRPGLTVPGVRDLTSGVSVFRLSTLKHCLRQHDRLLSETALACANAELVARAAARARQIAAVTLAAHANTPHGRRRPAMTTALHLFRAGRRLRIPAPAAPVQRA